MAKKKQNKNTDEVKRQVRNWKEIFASYNTVKDLISRLYKELLIGVGWGSKSSRINMQNTRKDYS